MLSNRLGDREYFFGRTPSTLDAVIFSYLALLLKVRIVPGDCVGETNETDHKLNVYHVKDNPLPGGGQT